MSDQEGKQLKITIAVDNAALEQFKRAIREVTTEVSKLVETLNRAGGLLGGAGRGGGGVTASSRGGFNSQTGTTPGMQKPIGGTLTAPAEQMASGLRNMARGSVDALRQMETATRSTMERSSQNMKQFERSLDSLASKYKNIKDVSMGGVMSPSGAGHVYGGGPVPRTDGASFVPGDGRVVNRGGIDYVQGGPGMMSRAWKAMTSPLGGGEPEEGGGGGGGMMRRASSLLGIPPWALGAAGFGGAAVGAYGAFTGSIIGRDSAVSNETLSSQTDALRRQVSMQQSVGNLSMQVRRDPLMQYTMGKLTPNDLHAGLSKETFEAMEQQAMVKAGATGSLGDVGADWKDRFGAVLSNTFAGGTNENTIQSQAKDRAINDLRSQLMERQAGIVQQRMQSLSAEERTYIPEFHQSVSARMAGARQTGRGSRKRIDPMTGKVKFVTDFGQTTGLGTVYTNDEVNAQMAQIGTTVGRGAMSEGLAQSTLAMQYGGFSNALNLRNIGGQYGNPGLMSTFNRGMGSGGMDVTAGNSMAGILAQAMQAGNVSIGGGGAAQGMLSAFSTGTTGGDMRMARIAGQGVSAYDNVLSGGVDNLQKAINVMSANQAAPGMSVQAKHALESIGSVQMMNIMRTGDVPQELKDFGITFPMIQAYNSSQGQFAYSRYIGGTGNGGAVEEAALGARDAGGAGKYIGGLMKGKTFKNQRERTTFIQEQARLLGTAQHSMGLAPSNEAGMGRVLMELGQNDGLFGSLSGGGAYDPAAKTLAADAKRNQDAAKLAKEEWIAKNPGMATPASVGTEGASNALGAASIEGDTKKLHVALLGFITEIQEATRALKTNIPMAKAK